VARVTEWLDAIRKLLLDPTGGRPGVLKTHCSIALAGVLVHAGRWPEAEQLLLASLAHGGPSRLTHRVNAVAPLADLRVRQGRVDEAAELLALYEDHLAAAAPLAAVHLANGAAALAAAVTTRALDQLVGDALRSAPLRCCSSMPNWAARTWTPPPQPPVAFATWPKAASLRCWRRWLW
jgi:hypothetical protein